MKNAIAKAECRVSGEETKEIEMKQMEAVPASESLKLQDGTSRSVAVDIAPLIHVVRGV